MRGRLLLAIGFILSVAGLAFWYSSSLQVTPTTAIPLRAAVEAAPMCPWRNPQSDMEQFFPGATGFRTEPAILSRHLATLKAQLGRLPRPEENPFYRHLILRGTQRIGTIVTRRVKGEHGAIEVVMAVDNEGKLLGINLQRWREPEAVMKVLSSPRWLQSFKGGDTRNNREQRAAVPEPARISAAAVVEGVRSSLILLAVAEKDATSRPHH